MIKDKIVEIDESVESLIVKLAVYKEKNEADAIRKIEYDIANFKEERKNLEQRLTLLNFSVRGKKWQ